MDWSETLRAPVSDVSVRDMLEELNGSTLRIVIVTVAGLYLLVHLVVTPTWPQLFAPQMWSLTLLVLPFSLASYRLLDRDIILSEIVWQLGMLICIALAIRLFRLPELAYLYAVLPFIATVTVSWKAGLVIGSVIATLLYFQAFFWEPRLPIDSASMVALSGIFGALVGRSHAYALLTVTQWALTAREQARLNLEDARERRAELLRLVKDLDQAYLRLGRANAALMAAWRAAEEAERFRAAFATNLSHELRTPLSLIIGFAEMMVSSPEYYENTELPGPYRHDMETVYYNTRHLLEMLNDVLDMARMDVGKTALSLAETSLYTLVEETVDMVRDYIAAKGLNLDISMAQDLPSVHIDHLRVRQVLLNLLVNAARFSSQKGSISIKVTHSATDVMFLIEDNGPGIAPENLDHLFDEFASSSNLTGQRGWSSGTGLGLPISKRIVEMHRGKIGVNSVLGRGSTFWFTLPSHTDAAPVADGYLLRTGAPRRSDDAEPVIVTVYPDRRMASVLQRYMSDYRIITATTTEEANRLAEEFEAAAMIVDNAQIANGLTGHLLHVVCSLPSHIDAAYKLGANDVLLKPVSGPELWNAIDRLAVPLESALIVDDDPDLVSLLVRMLRARLPAGRCRRAYSGREALELLRKDRPSLVLLDQVLPDLDGRAVLKEMQADPVLADIPVIIVTGESTNKLEAIRCTNFSLERANGFAMGEVAAAIRGIFDGLIPGWH